MRIDFTILLSLALLAAGCNNSLTGSSTGPGTPGTGGGNSGGGNTGNPGGGNTGGGNPGGGTGGGNTGGGNTGGGGTGMGGGATVCTGLTTPANDSTQSFNFGGMSRSYIVHIPPSYDATRGSPLVLNFHGFTEAASIHPRLTGMNPKADAAGYLAVYPSGTGNPIGWNAGTCCGSAVTNMIDDVGFVRAMLDDIDTKLCVNKKMIFSAGFSNGGMLTHRLACTASDRIAAFAAVSGPLVSTPCTPSRPVPIMHFHGTADQTVAYNGDPTMGFPDIPTMMADWATRDACSATPAQTFMNGMAACQTWSGCGASAEVVLCTITGGGHAWPSGGINLPGTTRDIDADDQMWAFFQKHPLP